MANNPVVQSLIFLGNVAGQASIQAQGIAGGLTFLLPNTLPIEGQLLDVQSINGNNVFLGWASSQSLSNIPLSALAQSGATTNQIIEWNGTSWAPASAVPGAGTVTSVALSVPAELSIAGSPITTAGTLALSWASGTGSGGQGKVIATPGGGGAGAYAGRVLVAGDIPALAYLPSSTVVPANRAPATHNFLTAYDNTTGLFAIAQPAAADLSDSAASAGNVLRANGTIFVSAALAVADLSDGSHVIVDTGSYADPAWITSLAGAKITGNISGNAASITGSITSSQVSDLAANTVTSFNSRQGIVAPQSGDYASFYDAVGAAATAQSNAEAFATSAVGVETSRAEGVEATLTSLQGNGSNGQPAASNNHVATGNNLSLPGTSLNSFITGSVSSGAFVGSETVTQANSGATATTATPPVDSLGRLIVVTSTILGAPNATDIWTGGTSAATFTPTAIPVAIDSASYGATVTLSAAAAYTATNTYSVLVSKLTNGGAHTGILFAQTVSGTNFTVFSSDSTDDSSIYWACFGKTAGD